MKTQPDNSVTRVTSRLAATLAVIVALSLPSVYFGLSYLHQRATLQTKADFIATRISQLIINTNPDFWQYEVVRLRTHLNGPDSDPNEVHRIFDLRGIVVAQDERQIERPSMMRAADLIDSGIAVGHLEIIYSLRPMLWRTAGIGFLGLLLGGAT